jgi:hypothetical protein
MKRGRSIGIVISAVLCLGLAGGYYIYVRAQGRATATELPASVANPATVLAGPHVVLRSSALGAHYGQLAAVPLDNPAGARASLGLNWERTYATRTAGVCLFAKRGVRTGQESLLAETRSVDDQVEWLDDGRLLHALSRPGCEATTSNVWAVPAHGAGAPAVFIPEASSPAVVR